MLRTSLLLLLTACRVELGPAPAPQTSGGGGPSGEVTVYTSMYQHVVDALERRIERALPRVSVRWVRLGSEKIAQRAETEWAAGGTRACLLMTSDVFWYQELADKGRLAPHFAPNVLRLDRSMVQRDGLWSTARISLMVIGHNHELLPEPPARFDELTDPAWRGLVTMGDPLASGSMFTTVSFLTRDPGWSAIEALFAQQLVANGGNSSVLSRLESGEQQVGIVLLENLLAARAKNSPTRAVYPSDGAIPIPGPIALTANCANPIAARAVYDFIQSPEGQGAMIDGGMYSALPDLPPPDGARALDTLALRSWEPGFVEQVVADKVATKRRWAELASGSR